MVFSRLTYLALELNYLLDRGYYTSTVEEIKHKIRNKSLFNYLENKTKDDYFDLSLLDDNDRKELLEQFEDMADSIDEDRKMGIQKNGICLLLAYVIELIQRRRKEPEKD